MSKVSKPRCKKLSLLPIFDALNDKYFGGLICAGIGWRELSIDPENVEYGECNFQERFISINTLLKDSRISDMFVEYVIFHEMCHLVYHPSAATTDGHSDGHHNARFQSIEKRYPRYQEAIDYDAQSMPAITEKWRAYRNSLKVT